ncbi:MAG: putative PLP-dependent enzyme involved in cell wall biosis [Acidimicrobiia bacterium]|nr:putative PLP-dependent enzyme involved in cell wall biosis [Acidimicrobiia bacterium]
MSSSAGSVPLVDLGWQHRLVETTVRQGLDEVMNDQSFVGGPKVSEFEQSFARYVGAQHCVGVANGTDALELMLRACDIGAGDAVVLPTNTFIATAEAVVAAGARVVLVDCDPVHHLIDVEQLDATLERTRAKAIIGVDLFGQIAPFEQLLTVARHHGCLLFEDAAQSQGARRFGSPIGELVTAAATSFYPGKNLGAYGDGGAVITNSPELAARVRMLGSHGSAVRYQHEVVGRNSRLDAFQAVVLSAKLSHLDHWNAARRSAAELYRQLLGECELIELPEAAAGNEHVWHLYVVKVPERDRVLESLNRQGIGAGIHYPVPVHLAPAFADLGLGAGAFPVAEQLAQRMLSLPLFPGITAAQQEQVAESVVAALQTVRA